MYIGEMNYDGVPHGKGFLRLEDGAFYFGDWKNGMKCGKGIQSEELVTYEGDWLDNQRHGRGVLSNKAPADPGMITLSVYEGEWKLGNCCGKGTAVFSDNSTYEGDWENDEIHGSGVMRWPDGTMYDGKFEKDERCGYGTFWWPTGERYEGNWRKNLKDGFGVFYFAKSNSDNDLFRGEWKEDQRSGKGTLRLRDGDEVLGEWNDNVINGYAEIHRVNGAIWKGYYVNNIRKGKGTFEGKEYTFEGEYDARRKKGVIKWPNGDIWEGSYLHIDDEGEEEQQSCEGVMTFAETGNVMKGIWLDFSMKNGKGEMTMWLRQENKLVRGEWVGGRFREHSTQETHCSTV